MTRRNDLVYLQHMRDHALEAMEILGTTPRDQLGTARVLQLALLHLVEIVGEAARQVSPGTQSKLTAIPWRDLIGMRNRIIHGYNTVKINMLWDTVVEDLPALCNVLDQYLKPTED